MRNVAEDIIAITQAALDGEKIEVLVGETSWSTHVGLRFDWDKYLYRVKPEPQEIEAGGWKFKVQPNYGIAIYFIEGEFVGNMLFRHIETLHAFSQKAQGIESPQYREPEVSQEYSAGYLAGYKVGKSDHLKETQ
jgi:hypothetical protein